MILFFPSFPTSSLSPSFFFPSAAAAAAPAREATDFWLLGERIPRRFELQHCSCIITGRSNSVHRKCVVIRRGLLESLEGMLNHLYRRCLCTAATRPWLFVGLGNPGEKYKGTRHNVGFEMIDAFAESHGIAMNTSHCKAIFGQGFVGEFPVLLAKPQTYMNLSGESAGPMAAYYKLPLDRVLVIHDDMDLPCGVLRLHDKGGHGSHNGLKSVIYHFRGNREFPRLRIGIGRPPGQMDPKAFLLQKFNVAARQRINGALEEGVEVLKILLSRGLTESARRFNREQKYKHIRVQTLPV